MRKNRRIEWEARVEMEGEGWRKEKEGEEG